MSIAFVTGGSGFVGRHLLEALHARGDAVRALVRSAAAEATVVGLGAQPVRGDLDDPAAMTAGMRGADVVYHVAALVEDWGSEADFHRVNVAGTEHVLAAARAAGVPRLVFVSTEAVLVGGVPIRNAREDHPRPARTLGLYPRTKAEAEQLVLAASSPALATIVVRPRFIWSTDDTSLLPKLVETVKQGNWRWIGGGHYLTSTCHVRNLVAGMLRAAEHGKGGEIYFLTDGEPVEFRSFMTELLRTQGVEPGDKILPHWAATLAAWTAECSWRLLHLAGKPPVTRTAIKLAGEEVTVDDSKARRELGYVNVISRAEGLRELAAQAPPEGERHGDHIRAHA
jgi:nucleoside-diphosphate-sugar epimerase